MSRPFLLPASFLLATGLLLCPSIADARTWHVTVDGLGDAPTVQAGIDSAAVADTVLVGPGTYNGQINFKGKDIVLKSEAGPEFTVLDGRNLTGSVVLMWSGEGRGAIIEGFTIKRGIGQSVGSTRRGGGIIVVSGSPQIRNNIIEQNTVSAWGAGIYIDGTSPLGVIFEGNIVRNNRAAGNGGGVALLTRGVVLNNQIYDNRCDDGDGGGLWLWTYDVYDFRVENNLILGNHAGDHGGGIVSSLATSGATALISGNLIAHNYAGGTSPLENVAGGGIAMAGGVQTIRHNTVVGNECPGTPSALGGGLATALDGSFLIEQNIIANAVAGGGIYCYPGLPMTIQNNLGWDNTGGHGVGACVGWELTDGNVVADPLFCNPAMDDFTVAQISPALTHPAGSIGAYPDPGCAPVLVETSSWGRIKQLFR